MTTLVATSLAAPPQASIAVDATLPFEPVKVAFGADAVAIASDGEVALIRRASGRVMWRRPLTGPVTGLWQLDKAVVVASSELSVFKASIGTRVWRRPLGCEAAGYCVERVVSAAQDGLLVTKQVADTQLLMRLAVRTGEPTWTEPVRVDFPRDAVPVGSAVALQEANPPFGLRFVSRRGGKDLGQWVRQVDGKAVPATDVLTTSAGTVVAVDRRPEDGSFFLYSVIDPRGGRAQRHGLVSRPAKATLPVWVGVSERFVWGFAPNPAAGNGILVGSPLAGGASFSERVGGWQGPVVVGDKAMFATRKGRSVTVVVHALETAGERSGRGRFTLDGGGIMLSRAGALVLVRASGGGRQLKLVSPETGDVMAEAKLPRALTSARHVDGSAGALTVVDGRRFYHLTY